MVAPSLSAAVRQHRPGFVLVASDVIYPAGGVDDYRDGVYRPYRSTDANFRVDAPLLGLPGNHDWYDGLAGFMYHFADHERRPAATGSGTVVPPTPGGPGRWVRTPPRAAPLHQVFGDQPAATLPVGSVPLDRATASPSRHS